MPNEELGTAIRQVKSGKAFNFALIAKSGAMQLALDKRKVSGEDIATMKKTAGGGNVIRGTCTAEDGTLIFSSANPPSDALAAVLRKKIKEETGLTVNCAFRASGDTEEEAESEDEAPAPAKAAAAGPAPTPAAPAPAALAKRPLMVDFADLVKANAAKIKDQPEAAKLARAIKTALDADKLADAATLIAALKRQVD